MSKLKLKKFSHHLNITQRIAVGFALIILIGTVLLMIPAASRSGQGFGFFNALFTSASAVCVTGLVVADTYTQFSGFGQGIILVLIQIGGLGFMTFGTLISMAIGKKIGLKERSTLMESVNTTQIGGIVKLVRRIFFFTLAMEITGAILLAARFIPEFGVGEGIWAGVFHSISAYCNAGFDIMGRFGPYSSLVPFAKDALVNYTIMVLIIVGGIGFLVVNDIIDKKWHFKKYSLHAKIALIATAVLIGVSAFIFFAIEYSNTLAEFDLGGKITASLFQAVTPRTAGFNTVDTAALTPGGTLLTMILMIIGAGPGSTAGGMKITTFVIIILAVISYIRRTEDVNTMNRRIDDEVVRRAFLSGAMYIMIAFIGTFMLTAFQGLPIVDSAFESFSALGTVGLSTGLTRALSPLSQFVMILLMYTGRVGSITVFMAVAVRKNSAAKNPTEKLLV